MLPNRNDQGGDSYRYGFNGMEKDDEVTNVEGSHLDFGARIYDSRVARWLSPDAFEKTYPSLTTYGFAANSPIVLLDSDGNVVVDPDGNPVTYDQDEHGNPIRDSDGNIKWSKNATPDIKQYGEAMLLTSEGTTVFKEMQDNDRSIHIHIAKSKDDPNHKRIKKGTGFALGETMNDAQYKNIQAGKKYKDADDDLHFNEETGMYDKGELWNDTHIIISEIQVDKISNQGKEGYDIRDKNYEMVGVSVEEGVHSVQNSFELSKTVVGKDGKHHETSDYFNEQDGKHEVEAEGSSKKAQTEYETKEKSKKQE